MQAFKLIAMALVAVTVVLAGLLGASGLFAYQIYKSTPALSAADMQVGGAQPPAEREALVASCASGFGTSEACGCLADKAGTALSRFERMYLTATFAGSPTKMMQLAAAAAVGGVSEDQIESVADTIEGRLQPVMSACGWN